MKPATIVRYFFGPLLLIAMLFLPLPANAQTVPLVTQSIDPAKRQTLGQTVHPLVKLSLDSGRADSALPMKDMLLKLNSSVDQNTLKQYIASLHNPSSTNFHKWLTPEQYAQKFGAADSDVSKVSAWLQSSGFKVEQVSRSKSWIRFSGTASQVETAFQAEIHKYSLKTGTTTETHYANASNISIPAALSPVVAGVVSLNNFFTSPQHTTLQKMARGANGKMSLIATGAATSSQTANPQYTNTAGAETNYMMPGDFSTIYDAQSVVASGVDGTGVTIAIVGRSDINMSDVEAFRTVSGLPFNDPTVTYATTDPGDVSGDDVEATLDVEWSGAIAPKAKINYVIGASTTTTDGVDVSSSYIVDNVVAPIMSVSFGECEALVSDSEIAFYQTLWQQAAAEGITVMIAAGDSGASGCNDPNISATVYGYGVNALATTPYNTAVGGTEFNDLTAQDTYWNLTNSGNQSSAKGYIPEAAWNESCADGLNPSSTNCYYPPYELGSYSGGGGASSCYSRTTDDSGNEFCAGGAPKPTWQTGVGVPDDGVRDIPDVSLAAAGSHDPFILCFEGSCQWTTNSDGSVTLTQGALVGGTSDASPSMASIMALVEQKTGAPLGDVNYKLYSLASIQSNTCNSSNRTDPTQTNSCIFNDITQGSNAVPCYIGHNDCQGIDQPVQVGLSFPNGLQLSNSAMDGHSAGAGFDLASGLGSIDVANLVNGWGKQTQADSTTTLALSQTTFQHGATITLTGTVAAVSGTSKPTGEVVITVSTGNVSVLSIPVSSGTFSGSTINLPGGTYTVTASYSGDTTFAASTSAPVSITVTPENSTISATSFAYQPPRKFASSVFAQTDAAYLGYPWFLQFNVAGASGATGLVTGSIKLTAGSKTVGTYPVSSTGEVYISCGVGNGCDFPVGVVNFTAAYSGDASFNPGTTTYQFTLTRGFAQWATQVSSSTPTGNSTVNAWAFFDQLIDPAIPPTGIVTLTRSDTGAVLGTGTLDKTGVATIPFNVGTGSYTVLATWPGDANYTQSADYAEVALETYNTAGTLPVAFNFNVSGGPYTLGQATTYTATITPVQKNSSTPIGYIDLYVQNGPISPFYGLTGRAGLPAPQQIELAGGKATGVIHWTTAGTQTIYAVYEGDGNFAGNSTSVMTATVAPSTPSITVQTNSVYVGLGSTTSVTAQITNPLAGLGIVGPTGSIQFFDSLNGGGATAIGTPQGLAYGNNGIVLSTLATTLPAGSHIITATYLGDPNWNQVTAAAPAAVVVTSPDFALTPPPGTLAVSAGQSESITLTTQSILGYAVPIVVTCGTLPVGITCNTATITPGSDGSISLSTTAPGTTTSTLASNQNTLWRTSGALSLAGLLLFWLPRRTRTIRYLATVLLLLGFTAAGLTGCSGGGSSLTPTLSITSSNTKVASATGVTFQATASSGAQNGSVTFYSDTVAIGQPVALANGVATLNISSLSIGTHAITARYTSDDNSASSMSSDTIQQSITGSFTLTLTGTSGTATHVVNVPVTLN